MDAVLTRLKKKLSSLLLGGDEGFKNYNRVWLYGGFIIGMFIVILMFGSKS